MKTQTKTFGLDLDNTAFDFTQAMRTFVAEQSGLTDPSEILDIMPAPTSYDHDNWDWSRTAFPAFREAFNAAEKAGGLYADMTIRKGAAEVIAALKDAGHSIHVITARDADFEAETRESLAKHGVEFDSLVFSNDKQYYSKKLGGEIDVFLDDSDKHLKTFAKHGIEAIAFHEEYNASVTDFARITCWTTAHSVLGI